MMKSALTKKIKEEVKESILVDCKFKHTDVMGLVFDYLSLYEQIYVQGLDKKMYHKKVPTFVYTVELLTFPKLQPRHEFINMVRTMNRETHQYKSIEDF